MRVTRILAAFTLTVGIAIGVAASASAASGPWMQTAAGGFHTCAINTAKSLYCWGLNESGQIGKGTAGGNQVTPRRVGAPGVWARISAGLHHTCGITTARNLYCWGYNDYGQIGKGTSGGNQLSRHRVGAPGVWANIAAGGFHSCGITTARNLYCWGSNNYGQIGKGTSGGNQLSLHRVGAAGVWTNIAAGGFHTCGITTARNLYCWGSNNSGQIGKGTSGGNQLSLYRVL